MKLILKFTTTVYRNNLADYMKQQS